MLPANVMCDRHATPAAQAATCTMLLTPHHHCMHTPFINMRGHAISTPTMLPCKFPPCQYNTHSLVHLRQVLLHHLPLSLQLAQPRLVLATDAPVLLYLCRDVGSMQHVRACSIMCKPCTCVSCFAHEEAECTAQICICGCARTSVQCLFSKMQCGTQ